jgi:hypothetical protein
MVLQSGDKVYLIHTGIWGTVVRLSGADMAMVRIPGDPDEFPVHIDDMALTAPEQKPNVRSSGTKSPAAATGSFSGADAGLFVAISVDPGLHENRKAYLFLLNDTAQPVQFEAILDLPHTADKVVKGDLPAHCWQGLFELPMDVLNDHPGFHLKSWTRDGLRQVAFPEYHSKIKAKSVITHQDSTIYMPFHAYLITVPTSVSAQAVIPLKTKRPSQPGMGLHRLSNIPEPEEKASFETILDLHAEKLFPDPAKYTESEIFQRQLLTFDQYLEKAIRMGVPRVYVIHGVGKGKLKDSILERCESNPYILKAVNAYHPLFGFGATELFFEVQS